MKNTHNEVKKFYNTHNLSDIFLYKIEFRYDFGTIRVLKKEALLNGVKYQVFQRKKAFYIFQCYNVGCNFYVAPDTALKDRNSKLKK